MSRDDGGPAFSFAQGITGQQNPQWKPGMSLLAWFAGQALAGAMANHVLVQEWSIREIDAECFHHAENMIAELRKREKHE